MTYEQAVEIAESSQIIAQICSWKGWSEARCMDCGAECSGGITCGTEKERSGAMDLGGLTCLPCYRLKGQAAVERSAKMEIEKSLQANEGEEEDCEYWQAHMIALGRNGVRVEIPQKYDDLIAAITLSFAEVL